MKMTQAVSKIKSIQGGIRRKSWVKGRFLYKSWCDGELHDNDPESDEYDPIAILDMKDMLADDWEVLTHKEIMKMQEDWLDEDI